MRCVAWASPPLLLRHWASPRKVTGNFVGSERIMGDPQEAVPGGLEAGGGLSSH